MPVRQLPPSPSLEHLKYQAQDLRRTHAARTLDATQRLREFHPRFGHSSDDEIFSSKLALSDAQLAIAREYGFASWPRLKKHIETPGAAAPDRPYRDRIPGPIFRRAVDLIDAGDLAGLRSLLQQQPGLIHQRVEFEGGNYFQNPSLLEFVAENPVRRGTLPSNIVEIAQLLIAAGADQRAKNEALTLVATGRVARECKVQEALIALLSSSGADVNLGVHAAALHGEFDAVRVLRAHGAALTLPVAAALDDIAEFTSRLPTAKTNDRHLALALASVFGRTEIVSALLDRGEDPNRYNPVGAHSHSTPLHQAALAGHFEVVKLLVNRGARLDIKDILWSGTPADWAEHANQPAIEKYLRERMIGEKPR